MKTLNFTSPVWVKILVSLALIAIGLLFFNSISFKVSHLTYSGSNYIAVLHSQRTLTVEANIVTGSDISAIRLNGNPVKEDFPYPKTRVSHQDKQFGSVYILPLQKGANRLQIEHTHSASNLNIRIAQHYSFWHYLVFFITILVPIAIALFSFSTTMVDKLLAIQYSSLTGVARAKQLLAQLKYLPLAVLILIVGIAIRLWYAIDMGYIQYQHDYAGHIEYIRFFANEFFIPLPHKAWEFPQQPVYYIFNGSLHALLESFGMHPDMALRVISFFTSVLSCIGLLFSLKLIRRLSDSPLVHTVMVGFLCFTPSLIYMSSRINNDPWTMAFACISLYYIVASYQENWSRYFFRALLFTSLLFLTKVSSLVIELLFFGLLVASYLNQAQTVKRPLFYFCLGGLFILGYTIHRGYYPTAGELALVNSGIWGGQDLRPLGLHYFFSFNFSDLLVDAQGNITGEDNHIITRSFPTYHYITMLFGEFNYTWWRDQNIAIYYLMQLTVVLGLIIPLGWLGYIFKQKNLIDWLFIVAVATAFFLLIRFIITYPSVSNTDFRYHAAIMAILAYFFATGLNLVIKRFYRYRKFFYTWLAALFYTNIYFMFVLIRM